MPPPEDDETPDEDEIPGDEDEEEEEVPAVLPADEDPPDPDESLTERCGTEGVKCANFAPATAAAPAASSPIRQVIFLTRRRPSSRARTAAEYWFRFTPKSCLSSSVT